MATRAVVGFESPATTPKQRRLPQPLSPTIATPRSRRARGRRLAGPGGRLLAPSRSAHRERLLESPATDAPSGHAWRGPGRSRRGPSVAVGSVRLTSSSPSSGRGGRVVAVESGGRPRAASAGEVAARSKRRIREERASDPEARREGSEVGAIVESTGCASAGAHRVRMARPRRTSTRSGPISTNRPA